MAPILQQEGPAGCWTNKTLPQFIRYGWEI